MHPAILRSAILALSAATLLTLAGCGGGSSSNSGGGGTGGGGGNQPTTITLTFVGSAPTAVATQIGTGAYTAASLSSGKLTVAVPYGTTNYSVAYICPPSTVFQPPVNYYGIVVWQGSTQDGSAQSTSCDNGAGSFPTGNLAVSINASAVTDSSTMTIATYNNSGSSSAYLYSNVENIGLPAPTGTDRVEVFINDPNYQVIAAKSFPNQIVPGSLNGGNPVTLSAADQVTHQPISYSSLPSGYSQPLTVASIFLALSNTDSVAFSTGYTLNDGNISQYAALPSTGLAQGDFYKVDSTASSQSDTSQFVRAVQTLSAAAPVTVVFPAPLVATAPTPAAWPTLSVAYTGFSGSDVYKTAGVQWAPNASNNYDIYIVSSATHQNGSNSIAIPDLSGITGFPSAPPSGTTINWSVSAVQSPVSLLAPSPANITLTQVGDGGSYIVP